LGSGAVGAVYDFNDGKGETQGSAKVIKIYWKGKDRRRAENITGALPHLKLKSLPEMYMTQLGLVTTKCTPWTVGLFAKQTPEDIRIFVADLFKIIEAGILHEIKPSSCMFTTTGACLQHIDLDSERDFCPKDKEFKPKSVSSFTNIYTLPALHIDEVASMSTLDCKHRSLVDLLVTVVIWELVKAGIIDAEQAQRPFVATYLKLTSPDAPQLQQEAALFVGVSNHIQMIKWMFQFISNNCGTLNMVGPILRASTCENWNTVVDITKKFSCGPAHESLSAETKVLIGVAYEKL
jgi:hypothetical protein